MARRSQVSYLAGLVSNPSFQRPVRFDQGFAMDDGSSGGIRPGSEHGQPINRRSGHGRPQRGSQTAEESCPYGSECAEIVLGGFVDILDLQLERHTAELAMVAHLRQDVANMAVAKMAVLRAEIGLDQMLERGRIGTNSQFRASVIEQLAKLCLRGSANVDLVRNPAEERLVNQSLGIKVSREDDELIKRRLQLLAARQAQVVVSSFQGHDPAIEQLVD